MPDLDFSDVLQDPDLVGTFDVNRRTETISGVGRAVITSTLIEDIVGSVQHDKLGQDERGADAQMTARSVTVITTYRLRAASDGVQADQIIHGGTVYTVDSVDLWTKFGAGYMIAHASSHNASDAPPT